MNTTDNGNILLMFEEINQKLERVGQWIDKIEQSQSANNADTNQDLINEISQLKSELDVFYQVHNENMNELKNRNRPAKGEIEFTITSMPSLIIIFHWWLYCYRLRYGSGL